jgi:hypothetical protein
VLNNSVAIISEANSEYVINYGGVKTSKMTLDFSRKPLLVMNIKTADPAWFVQAKMPNEQYGFYVSNERSDTGRIVIDLVEMMQKYHSADFEKYKNITVNDVELYLVAFGKQRASFGLEDLQIIYPDNSLVPTYQSVIDVKNKLYLKETASEYWLINPTNTMVNGSYISAQYQINNNSKTLKSSNIIPFSMITNRGISFEKNILKENSFKFFAIDGFNTLKPLLDTIIDVNIQ